MIKGKKIPRSHDDVHDYTNNKFGIVINKIPLNI